MARALGTWVSSRAQRARAMPISPASPRMAGCGDSARAIACDSGSGTSGLSRDTGGASARRTARRISARSSPSNSGRPVSSSQARMPSANTSVAAVGASPRVCSGAM